PAASNGLIYKNVIPINSSTAIMGWSVNGKTMNGNGVSQEFRFNKATGKKITLADTPADKYASDGAFTLVNGVQNEKGMSRSRDFLGFEGTDCNATIDFGQLISFTQVTAHTLEQRGSWIYYPQGMEIFVSDDGKQFRSIGAADVITDQKTLFLQLPSPVKARYLRVWVKNKGVIPTGLPGADHRAWLFVDEIEVN
ncbi:MAG: discoidin domain-containing protein, partial [Sphingobacteriales bacterium]